MVELRPIPPDGQPTDRRIITIAEVLHEEQWTQAPHQAPQLMDLNQEDEPQNV